MTELAALNVKINGDSADLQSDIAKAKKQLASFDAQANKANKGTKGFSGSLAKLGNVSGSTRAKIQNTSFQLQDIAVQLSMGTRASTVFAQQLPQLASGFGAIGAVVGVLAAVGIPALAFAFAGAKDEVVDADEAMDLFLGSLNSVTEAFGLAKTPLSDLREEFGKYSEQVRQASILNAQASLSFGLEGLAGAVAVIEKPLDNVREKLRRYNETVIALNQTQAALGERTISNEQAFADAEATVDDAAVALREAAAVLGMSADEATRLDIALQQLSDAEGMEEVADASAKALDLIKKMFPPTEKIPPEMANIVSELERVLRAAAAGVTALESMGDAAADAASKTAAAAAEFSAAREFASRFAGEEMVMGQAVVQVGRGEPPPEVTTPSGGGRADPLIAQLGNVQNALMTQEEKQIESFQRQQETLQQALEQRLLTQQEYNALMEQAQSQHADKMTAIDAYRYGTDLQKADQFLGDMASAFQSGNEDMLRISKAFGAAQALVSAFTGAAEALKLPFPENLAAFAKVLATGLGAVQSIKGVTPGGGGASAAGAVASAAAAPSAAPLDVRLSGMSADEFISGASIQSLFDRLQDEAGDRGLRVSFA